jgi:hypothetical protein
VHEPRAVHRLDDRRDRLAVAGDLSGQPAQPITVGPHRGHLHGSARLIEDPHLEPLARQVQSGVQHVLGLLVLVALTTPTLSPARPSSSHSESPESARLRVI